MNTSGPTYDKDKTRYERSRKLLKWAVFSALISALALISGDTWKPDTGEVYFSATSVVIAGFGEVLFDRKNESRRHDGRSDYTTIFSILSCVGLGLYAAWQYGEVSGAGSSNVTANPPAFGIFIVSLLVGGTATYYSEARS